MDKLFREKLQNHEVQVDSFVWETLQDQLKHTSFFNKTWFSYLSYAAIFFLTIGFTIAGSQQYFNYVKAQNQDFTDQADHLNQYYRHLLNNANLQPQVITQKIEVPVEVTKIVEVPVEVTKFIPAPNIEEILSKYQYFNYTDEQLVQLNEKIELIRAFDLSELPEKSKEEIGTLNKIDLEKLLVQGIENSLTTKEDEDQEIYLLESSGLGMALDGSGAYSYKKETSTQQIVDNILRKKMTNLKGFQIGLGGTFFNSWILNKRPTEISTNSIEYKFTTGGQYGFTVGYNFNPRLGLEIGMAKANQGQRIIHYANATQFENEVRLGYMHIPLAFKYKWEQYSSLTKHPIVMNYLFGLQYSKLLSIDGNMNDDIIMWEDMQRTNDIGFLVGLDYDIFLGNNYFVTIGARSTFGTDLNAVMNTLYGSTDTKTDNFTVGLKASFNYLFRMN